MDEDFLFATVIALWVPLMFAALAFAAIGHWEPEWTPLLLVGITPGVGMGGFVAFSWWRKRE